MSKKAYICIGGPLDQQFATTNDFASYIYHNEVGMYAHLRGEYMQYNGGGTYGNSKGYSSMVWIHKDLIKSPISPRLR